MSVRPGFYDMARGENHRGEKVEGGKVVRTRSSNPWPSCVFMCVCVICATVLLLFG